MLHPLTFKSHVALVKLMAFYIPVPYTAHLMMAQMLPALGAPDWPRLLDFGVTAFLAVAGLYIYSKQVTSWQVQFRDVSNMHATEMSKLADRYEAQARETAQISAAVLEKISIRYETHAAVLADRYEAQTTKVLETIAGNMVVKGQLLDSIRELSRVSICPLSKN